VIRLTRTLVMTCLLVSPLLAIASPINIVAGENFYGDLAQQLGGAHVQVTSILNNPNQDPHLFEASATTAKALSQAQLVIYNGIDYDPWMEKLLSASNRPQRKVLIAGRLMQKKIGDNPHLWYNPATMQAMALAISAELQSVDPTNRADYRQRLQQVQNSLLALNGKIHTLRAHYAGTPVTATEPVFGYMAEALGLTMRNTRFQLAVMNDTEPSASDIAAFENDLKQHKVKVLLYNSQASDQSAKHVQQVALQAKIPVVGITETEPSGQHYQDWMSGQLAALARTLEH